MTSVITTHTTWHWSFWVQAIGLTPCVITVMLIPKKYLDVETAGKNKMFSVLSVDKKLRQIVQHQKDMESSRSRRVQSVESRDDNPYVTTGTKSDGQECDESRQVDINEEKQARKVRRMMELYEFIEVALQKYQNNIQKKEEQTQPFSEDEKLQIIVKLRKVCT